MSHSVKVSALDLNYKSGTVVALKWLTGKFHEYNFDEKYCNVADREKQTEGFVLCMSSLV